MTINEMTSQKNLFLQYVGQTNLKPLLLEIERAEGIFLYDIDGKRYTDLVSGVSVSNVGHNNPEVKNALKKQLNKHLHLMVYGEMVQSIQVKLAIELLETLPPRLDNVYFVNSGSEAMEGAIKLAKKYTQRHELISMIDAYHGSTHGALSLCGNDYLKKAYEPLLPCVKHIQFNDFESLEHITDETAAVFIEVIQAEAGIILPKGNYLQVLQKRCRDVGSLLVIDEIQTGIGRTGTFWAYEQYDIEPDILLTAKALGGGLPLGAFIASQKIMSVLKSKPILGHITTFGGHPLSCAAASAALRFLSDNALIDQVKTKEQLFLKYLKHNHIEEVRSCGLMMGIKLKKTQHLDTLMDKALSAGLVIDRFLYCDSAFRIAPPLIITKEEIKETCETLIEVLSSF